MNLREHNIEIMEQYKLLKHKDDFSIPLLVSSNPIYLNNLKLNKKLLYIGQETNTWMNSNKMVEYNIENIEEEYYNFLKKECNNKEFWRFLKQILKNQIIDSTIWSNTLIVSKKNSKGTPNNIDEISQMSLSNLIYLYEYFKPEITVITAGPNSPYFEIITQFLKQIDSKLYKQHPTINELMIKDLDKKIFYTYHPNFLQRKNKLKELALNVNDYVK